MNKYALAILLALAPALHAGESEQAKKDESRKVHADPRFKGKVVVIGTSSASFGEAPAGEDIKTKKLESLEPETQEPQPLPLPVPAKR